MSLNLPHPPPLPQHTLPGSDKGTAAPSDQVSDPGVAFHPTLSHPTSSPSANPTGLTFHLRPDLTCLPSAATTWHVFFTSGRLPEVLLEPQSFTPLPCPDPSCGSSPAPEILKDGPLPSPRLHPPFWPCCLWLLLKQHPKRFPALSPLLPLSVPLPFFWIFSVSCPLPSLGPVLLSETSEPTPYCSPPSFSIPTLIHFSAAHSSSSLCIYVSVCSVSRARPEGEL